MHTGLVHLHNILRWVILILLLLSIVKAYTGYKSGRVFQAGDRKTWLFTMISAHITLLIGLYQWLAGRYGLITYDIPEGVSRMGDKFTRFFQVEHPLGMIIGIILITLGYGMAKKPVSDSVKYKKAFTYFLIALIVILVTIPWPFREIVGRPWFPGM